MHDWVEANHRMAKVLKAKGYDYQYLFCQNSGHGIGNAKTQFLPHAIEPTIPNLRQKALCRALDTLALPF